jgi:hypothetical protein
MMRAQYLFNLAYDSEQMMKILTSRRVARKVGIRMAEFAIGSAMTLVVLLMFFPATHVMHDLMLLQTVTNQSVF